MGDLTLGQRIRELRLKKGWTQIQLAEGIATPSMLSQVESGKARPSFKLLSAFAERLEVPVENLLSNVELNLDSISTYKMATAMVAAQEYGSAIPLLRELVERPRASISTMEILFHLGECLLHTSQFAEAEAHFKQLQEYAVLSDDAYLKAKVLLDLGHIAFQRKLYQIACFQWEKALAESEKMEARDAGLQARLLHRLGQVAIMQGQPSTAEEYLSRAVEMYDGRDNLLEMAHAYLELARSCKQLGKVEQAAVHSERAHAVFQSIQELRMTIQLEIETAALYAVTDREEDAEQMLRYALSKAEFLKDRELQGMACAELAQICLRKGDLGRAVESCGQAQAFFPPLHVGQAVINRVLARVAVATNNPEEAKRRFQMAADGFKQADRVEEWEETLYELSRLYLQAGDHPRVIEILETIREYTVRVKRNASKPFQ